MVSQSSKDGDWYMDYNSNTIDYIGKWVKIF